MRLLVSFLLVVCLAIPVRAGQSLTFSCVDDPLALSSLEVLKVAYARLGIEVEGRILPAARALTQSEGGKTDGEVNRIKMPEMPYTQLLRVNIPINRVVGVAISCNKIIDTGSSAALGKYRVGIKRGILYAEKMTSNMPFVTRMADENQLLDMLLADRIDLFIFDRNWAEHQVSVLGGCLRVNEPPLITIPLYHYLHKRHKALIPEIARVLRQMKESGEVDRIIDATFDKLLRQRSAKQ